MSTIPQGRICADEVQARPDEGDPAAPDAPTAPTQVAPRQCGRCRQWFDGDPILHPGAVATWWLCPPCRTALLGDGPGRATR